MSEGDIVVLFFTRAEVHPGFRDFEPIPPYPLAVQARLSLRIRKIYPCVSTLGRFFHSCPGMSPGFLFEATPA
jgi:hypothetical protein